MNFEFKSYADRDIYYFGGCRSDQKNREEPAEIYYDELWTAIHRKYQEIIATVGFGPIAASRLDPFYLWMVRMGLTVLHEWLHVEGELSQAAANFATEQTWRILFDPSWPPERTENMVWTHVACPLKKGVDREDGAVTFNECLACGNAEKTRNCPRRAVRRSFFRQRRFETGVYHVTEITNPRRSYYERTHDYAESFSKRANMRRGSVMHEDIERLEGQENCEIFVEKTFTRGDESVRLVGSIDKYDEDGVDEKGNRIFEIIEWKTFTTFDFRLNPNEPEPDHVYQAQAYAALAAARNPPLRVDRIRIGYESMTKSRYDIPFWNEFEVEPTPPADLEERVWILHDAFKSGVPPEKRCPDWMCKECAHNELCIADYQTRGLSGEADKIESSIRRRGGQMKGQGYRKSDKEFESNLEQHKRGVEMIAAWLRSQGHEIRLAVDARSTEIIKDPKDKPPASGRHDYDIEDLTEKVRIDVKTTNSPAIWYMKRRLEAWTGTPLLLYYVFLKSEPLEVRWVSIEKLWRGREKAQARRNRSGEYSYIFPKEAAELIEGVNWEEFQK